MPQTLQYAAKVPAPIRPAPSPIEIKQNLQVPVIAGINPVVSPLCGTLVTITGENFLPGLEIFVAGKKYILLFDVD